MIIRSNNTCINIAFLSLGIVNDRRIFLNSFVSRATLFTYILAKLHSACCIETKLWLLLLHEQSQQCIANTVSCSNRSDELKLFSFQGVEQILQRTDWTFWTRENRRRRQLLKRISHKRTFAHSRRDEVPVSHSKPIYLQLSFHATGERELKLLDNDLYNSDDLLDDVNAP